MTTRSKSILILAGTLLLGLVIGALATGAIIGSRVDQFQQMRRRGGLPRMIEEAIQPTDEAQRRRLQIALDSMEARQSRLREYTIEQHDAIFDRLDSELDSILTPEQKTRMEQWEKSHRGPRGGRGGRGPGGPPPFGEPPPFREHGERGRP